MGIITRVVWRVAKWPVVGGIVGAAAVGLGLGYSANVKDAWHSSRAAQDGVARALHRERAAPTAQINEKMQKQYRPTIIERATGKPLIKQPAAKPLPPEIGVGKTVFDRRDAKGRITEIGKTTIAKGMPDHMNWRPAMPAPTKRTGNAVAGGAIGGAGLGTFLGLRGAIKKRKKRKNQPPRKIRRGR